MAGERAPEFRWSRVCKRYKILVLLKQKTLDFGLRRDDFLRATVLKIVIPA